MVGGVQGGMHRTRRPFNLLNVPFNSGCEGGMTFCFPLAQMLRKRVQPNPVSVEITGLPSNQISNAPTT